MERKYKDSGTKGIGLIPQSWDSRQLGVFFSENKKANSSLESVTALQFKYGEIIQKPNNGRNLSDKDKELLSKYTVIEPGDVIVNGLNLNFDLKSLRIAIARENGIITSAYIVLKPRKGVNPNYYNYVLKALDFQKILHGMGEGIRLTLSYDELKKLNVPAPAASIQSVIVDYLDKKCVEIDSLISLQEQMIEKLKAYKQSVITEAVTKGLDPNAKLVPSGIDWIGEIPAGWKVTVLRRFAHIILGKMLQPSAKFKEDSLEQYICAKDVHFEGIDTTDLKKMYFNQAEKELYQIQKGDMLVVEGGAGAAGSCVLRNDLPDTYIQNSIMIVRPKQGIDIRYIQYYEFSLVKKGYVDYVCNKATIPHFTKDKLSSMPIPLPPLSEQQAIATYLESKCTDIDRLIAVKQQKIEKLKDYKKSVIYEAVTGKTIIE
jgi:type I restriction enzyme S subunit